MQQDATAEFVLEKGLSDTGHDQFQPTSEQRKRYAAHQERLRRIAANAKPDTPIECPSASVRSSGTRWFKILGESEVSETLSQWRERQRQIPLPKPSKQLWFQIVGEVDVPPVIKTPTVEAIIIKTASRFKVSVIDIRSSRREWPIVLPRQIAIYLAKILTHKSLPEIGRRFGGRDHTTILHSIKKIRRLIVSDPIIAGHVAALKAELAT